MNALVTRINKLKLKKYRNQTGLFYFEGFKLLGEALDSKYRGNIKYIIAEESVAGRAAEMAGPAVTPVTRVTMEVYKKITDEEAFQGVMCVMEKPGESGPSYKRPVIVLCSVRDAGNVGTIIRTADALCEVDLILSADSADVHSSKTQRAAMGAFFRQSIKTSENIGEDIANLKKNGYNVLAAHLDRDSRPIGEIEFTAKTAVVFGNEGSGLDPQITEICDGKLIIPINRRSESLNVSVAAGIVLWEIKKRGKKDYV